MFGRETFETAVERSHVTFPAMTRPELTEQDVNNLVALVREATDVQPYRAGPRIRRLRPLLAKLGSETAPGSLPFPLSRSSGGPRLLHHKLRGGRGWR